MLDRLIPQSNTAGQQSWTSGKTLIILSGLAMVGVGFLVLLAVVAPSVLKTVGFSLGGILGVALSVIADIVLLYNFYKMLRDLGFL